MLAYTPVEFIYLETLAKAFIIPARQKQFLQENIFNNAPVRRIAIAMNKNSAFNGFYIENPFWYHQFDLRQIRILRGGQPYVDFDAADKCRFYVTTMKAMNFQDDIPSVPIDNFKFKDHYVLVFDLTSMQDATENCRYPELVGEPLRLELDFSFPLQNVTELNVLGERMSSTAADTFGVDGKNVRNGKSFYPTNNQPQLTFQVSVPRLFSLYVPTLDNDIFAINITQPSRMQAEHWIMIANSRQTLYFADSLGSELSCDWIDEKPNYFL